MSSTTTTAATAPKKKTGKESYGSLGKGDFHWFDPNDLTIVGLDSKDEGHPLLDPDRIDKPDPGLVESMFKFGFTHGAITFEKESPSEEYPDGRIIVVDGRQRVMAARIANARLLKAGDHAPVRVKGIVNGKAIESDKTFVIANTCHRDDSPVTRARKIERMRDRGYDDNEILVMFNISRGTLANASVLLKCVPDVLKAIEREEIAVTVGYELGKLPPEEQKTALEAMPKDSNATKRERTKAVRNTSRGEKSAKWGAAQVRGLYDRLELPEGEDKYEDPSLELVHALLKVMLGEDTTAKSLREFEHVYRVVRRVIINTRKEEEGEAEEEE